MNFCVSVAVITLTIGLWSVSGATEAPRRTGWSLGAGPRLQWLTGSGYDELRLWYLDNPGYGGELTIGYGLTDRWAGRIAASTNRHSGSIRSEGFAWAAVDLLFLLPLRRFDPYVLARLGKQAVTAFNVNLGQTEEIVEGTWAGWMGGGGLGVRCWVVPRVSLHTEAVYTYVRISDLVENDDTGTAIRLAKTYDGTTWGITILAVEYHW